MSTVLPAPAESSPDIEPGPPTVEPERLAGRVRTMITRRWVPIALTGILLGGLLVRLLGIAWGLPQQLHPDEWVIVRGAVDMAARHSFEPAYYFRPDHLEIQLSNLAYLLYSNVFRHMSPMQLDKTDPAALFVISRLITVAFGLGMIVMAFLIGSRFHRTIGVIAAALFAFFPPFVLNSHYATPDIPLTFAFMVVIYGCLRYLLTPTWRPLLLACLGVAIAFVIKYPGILGTLMIAIVIVISGWPKRQWLRIIGHGAGAIGAVIGFSFLISPVLFTNGAVVVDSLTGEANPEHPGGDGLGLLGSMGFYAGHFATAGGLILVLLFGLGAAFSVRLKLRASIPLWLGVIYWPLLSLVPLHWDRWGLPMYLTPLLVAPIGIYYFGTHVLTTRTDRRIRWAAAAVGTLLAGNLLLSSLAVSAEFRSPNTQTDRQSFAARGITGRNSISEGYSPLIPGRVTLVFDRFEVVDGRLIVSPRVANRAKMSYVVISSAESDRFVGSDPKYATQQRFYRMLAEQYPVVTTLRPTPEPEPTIWSVLGIARSIGYLARTSDGGVSGPTITVYAIPSSARA